MSCHECWVWTDTAGMVRSVLGWWSEPERVAEHMAQTVDQTPAATRASLGLG
jgi:hypothetical protein